MKNIDFTPRWHRRARHHKQMRRRRIVWGGLLLSSMCVWALWGEARAQVLKAELSALQQGYAQQATMVDEANALSDALVHAQARETRKMGLCGGLDIHVVFAELSNLLPRSIYLNRFEVRRPPKMEPIETSTPKNASGKKPTLPDLNLTISGHAIVDSDIGKLVNALSACQLLEEITLSYDRPNKVNGHRVREFEIHCRLPVFK